MIPPERKITVENKTVLVAVETESSRSRVSRKAMTTVGELIPTISAISISTAVYAVTMDSTQEGQFSTANTLNDRKEPSRAVKQQRSIVSSPTRE